jgi:hypothetical protein
MIRAAVPLLLGSMLLVANVGETGEKSKAAPDEALTIRPGVTPDRFTITDQKGRNSGYGIIRPDGSVEVYNPDSTRQLTLPPGSTPITPPTTIRPTRPGGNP